VAMRTTPLPLTLVEKLAPEFPRGTAIKPTPRRPGQTHPCPATLFWTWTGSSPKWKPFWPTLIVPSSAGHFLWTDLMRWQIRISCPTTISEDAPVSGARTAPDPIPIPGPLPRPHPAAFFSVLGISAVRSPISRTNVANWIGSPTYLDRQLTWIAN
jgi:hypothetical protein